MSGTDQQPEPAVEQPDPTGDEPDGPADGPDLTEALVRHVRTARAARPEVDPEDWAGTGTGGDDRYLRERPPHWE